MGNGLLTRPPRKRARARSDAPSLLTSPHPLPHAFLPASAPPACSQLPLMQHPTARFPQAINLQVNSSSHRCVRKRTPRSVAPPNHPSRGNELDSTRAAVRHSTQSAKCAHPYDRPLFAPSPSCAIACAPAAPQTAQCSATQFTGSLPLLHN